MKRHFLLISGLVLSSAALAAGNAPSFNYQGRLLNESGTAPLSGIATLKFGIYDPNGNCLLYEEEQSVDLNSTAGAFSVQVGQEATTGGKRTSNDPHNSMFVVFANGGTIAALTNASCPGGSYVSAAGASRKLRVTVTPQAGSSVTLSPDQVIGATPQSIVAETLQGIGPSQLILSAGTVTQSNLGTLTGASDASSLHHHDSVYAKKDAAANFTSLTIGGSNVCTTSYADSKFGGSTLDLTDLASNQSIKWDGSKWIAYTPAAGVSLGTSAGAAVDIGTIPNCAANEKLQMSAGPTYLWSCVSDGSQWATNGASISFGPGNVGIGTTNPGAKLEVVGTSGTTLKIVDGNQGSGRVLTSDANGVASWAAPSSPGVGQAPAFSVHKNGVNQTVSGISKVTFDTAEFDSISGWSSADNRYVPTVAGKYLFMFRTNCIDNSSASSGCNLYLYRNGGSVAKVEGLGWDPQLVTALLDMNGTTDYVEAYIHIGAGTTVPGSSLITRFSGALLAPLASGSVAGTGTANSIPYWASSTTLSNSPLAVSGSNVGVGTTSPAAKLDVNGGVRVGTVADAGCTASTEGTIRYNSATKIFQGCNGTAWIDLNATTVACSIVEARHGSGAANGGNLSAGYTYSSYSPTTGVFDGSTGTSISMYDSMVMVKFSGARSVSTFRVQGNFTHLSWGYSNDGATWTLPQGTQVAVNSNDATINFNVTAQYFIFGTGNSGASISEFTPACN